MRFESGGAVPARLDFDMLRAGLAAAQAATPTARASARNPSRLDPAEALVRLFAERRDGAAGETRAVLQGSFNPSLSVSWDITE